MNIGMLRTRITIEKNETIIDRYANHHSEWTPHFSCWATVSTSGQTMEEKEVAAHTVDQERLDVTVRYSSETACVNSKEYRIRINEQIYDIINVNDMGFKKECRKFQVKKKER